MKRKAIQKAEVALAPVDVSFMNSEVDVFIILVQLCTLTLSIDFFKNRRISLILLGLVTDKE